MAPWRIAEQTVVAKTPNGGVGPTLQFTLDPANAAQCRLRIVAPSPDSDAYEIVFDTGGLVREQVYQPRVLKPFARGPIVVPPEPIKVAVRSKEPEGETVLVNPLTNRPETDAERERREALAKLKAEREPTEAAPADGSAEAVPAAGGPDSTDPNSPGAQARRAAEAGVESSEPEKGIVSQGVETRPGIGAPNASNAVDQTLQTQGKPFNTGAGSGVAGQPGNPGPQPKPGLTSKR